MPPDTSPGVRAGRRAWWWRCLLPLTAWTALILVIATCPSAVLVSTDTTTALRVSRDLLQYPYHLGAFSVLAILFLRCFARRLIPDRRAALFTLLGVALVSMCSELLQYLTPTRTLAARDLVLDLGGAVIGIALVRIRGRATEGS